MGLRLAITLLGTAAICGCGDGEPGALESGDPLHAGAIRLPPPVVWAPEERAAERSEIRVPAPPFSAGIFPCSRCHAGGEPVADTAPTLSHRLHLDRDVECADCHMPDDEPEPKIPAAAVCFDCHEDLAAEPERVRRYFDAVKTAAGEYEFPRRWRTSDVREAHARHAKANVECAACHGEASNAPFTKPKSVPLMERCIACHEKKHQSTKCETCHDRNLEPQHRNIVLRHAADQRGCLDCHNPADRDTLRLASGKAVPFAASYVLCGQCHGTKLRDWKAGLHGKRTGMWDGRKEYLLCVHCHRDPHAPQYPAMKPDPPPHRPEDIK